jgi:hypothetical protein
LDDEIKKNTIGRASNTYVDEERRVGNLGEKICGEEMTWKTLA